jgi:predicted ATPase/DNA-binding winged helix-turn-helix (wHTH) protein
MGVQLASFGPFRLSPIERQLKKGVKTVPLSARALDALVVLIERAGQVVTQRELMSRVWPNITVEEANLRVQIAHLRRALGERSKGARYIVTVPGRGYCFVAPVTFSESASSPSRGGGASGRSRGIPPKLTRMVGRDDVVRALSEQLMMWRFVSIVGSGGIGKTTVAISIAHLLLDEFDGAVFFLDLAALTDAKLVAPTVARALGFMVQSHDPTRSLPEFISDQKILIVLDNCEHLIDAAAMLAERIVGETRQAHVLTTSREALRVEGEHVHLLFALECPPDSSNPTAAEALTYPAVQLFMERATASGHAPTLSDVDAPILAELCRRLDGIALAIELAASRAGPLGIHGTAKLLDNRFDAFWQGRRTALPRHQTMNALLDWSYNLLSKNEKVILARLSVLVGEFELDMARSIVADDEIDGAAADEGIASLLAKSLISKAEQHVSALYRLLETTRAFAEVKLAEYGETNAIARRHANYFSDILRHDQIVQARFGERNLSEYAFHIGNVRAALQWAFSDTGDLSVGVELAAGAAPLFIGLSSLAECNRWCQLALADLDDITRGTRHEMILQEAFALSSIYTTGNSDQTRAAIERGLILEEAFGDPLRKLQLLLSQFTLLMRLANFRGALQVAQQSETFAESINDTAGFLLADFMLGGAHHFIGDQAAAQYHGERVMARVADLGAMVPYFIGFDHRTYGPINFARALWLRGLSDRACSIVRTGIEAGLSGVNPILTCVSLAYGAPVFLWSGDLQGVEGYADKLVEKARQYSIDPYRAVGLGLQGAVAIARNDCQAGIDLVRTALEILVALRLNIFVIEFMGVLAEGLRTSGQLEAALATIHEAIERSKECGSTYELAELLRIKAGIVAAANQDNTAAARDCLTQALVVAREQSALALELRIMMEFVRLLTGTAREKARNDLGMVYGRFTEGFETADLKAARQLLLELV